MNEIINTVFRTIADFLSSRIRRRLLLIGILALIALIDFFSLGLARRTFVFYTVNDGVIVVEDRMLKHSKTKEGDLVRYTEETLLGPVAPGLLPLFPRETRLKSLLFRSGTVYADFSEHALLPPLEGGRTYENFQTLHEGILRNFSYVKDVKFFIEGRAIFEGFGQDGLSLQIPEI